MHSQLKTNTGNPVQFRHTPFTPYKTFGSFLKKKFGYPVYKIGIDAGFNCPHRAARRPQPNRLPPGLLTKIALKKHSFTDLLYRSNSRETGGCTYCNPGSFSPPSADPSLSIPEQIKKGIKSLKKRYKTEKFIAYFQTHTNTLASAEKLRRIYQEALEFDEIIGISIGTRPDCLSDKTLDLIKEVSQKTFLIMELGLESANDKTLNKINRNHTVKDFTIAINKLKEISIHTCAHIILGLPGENLNDMLKTADYLSSVGVDGVKIHHFHVVKGTGMENEYYLGKIKTFTFEDYKPVVIKFLDHTNPEIIIHRLVVDYPDELLIAPKWNLWKSQILKSINDEMIRLNSRQGKMLSAKA